MPTSVRICPRCGGNMSRVGFSKLPFLSEETLQPEDMDTSLAAVGLEVGDLITMRARGGLKGIELSPL